TWRRPPARAAPLPSTTLFRSHAGPAIPSRCRRGFAGQLLGPREGVLEPLERLAVVGPAAVGLGGLGIGPCLLRVGNGLGEVALRSEEHTSELQSRENLVCRLL